MQACRGCTWCHEGPTLWPAGGASWGHKTAQPTGTMASTASTTLAARAASPPASQELLPAPRAPAAMSGPRLFRELGGLTEPTLAVLTSQGFERATPVQEATIPLFCGNKVSSPLPCKPAFNAWEHGARCFLHAVSRPHVTCTPGSCSGGDGTSWAPAQCPAGAGGRSNAHPPPPLHEQDAAVDCKPTQTRAETSHADMHTHVHASLCAPCAPCASCA